MDEPETITAEVAEVLDHLPAVRASQAIVARDEITVDEIVAQRQKIIEVMQAVMTEGVHYGKIPGVKNPSLFKPGAETINVALRLAPHYMSEKIWHDDGHLTVSVVCTLKHIPTGLEVATGEGLCTTRETRYAYRQGERLCPACGAPAIIRGKKEYGGGWLCWAKKNGCGAKYADGDPAIESQAVDKVENPEIADTYNTVLKMADKRALVAAVLNGTAASDVFTQDVEDTASSGSDAAGAVSEPHTATPEPARSKQVPIPKSWAQIEKLVRTCDNPDEAWPLFQAFVRATSYHLYGEADSTALSKEQKAAVAQKAAGAAVWLREHEAETQDGPFRFYLEPVVRQAFAAMLDGQLLEIPDYTPPEPPAPDDEVDRIAAEAFGEAPPS